MARRKKVKAAIPQSGIGLHGFYRVAIVDPEGEIVGDSGYNHNLITSCGVTGYLTYNFASSAGSGRIHYAALGSGSLVASNATILPASFDTSLAMTCSKTFITRAASSDGDTARYLATWVSGTSTALISNVGLYSTQTGSIFCGGTYASSSVASNQAINLTYDVVFIASAS